MLLGGEPGICKCSFDGAKAFAVARPRAASLKVTNDPRAGLAVAFREYARVITPRVSAAIAER